MSIFIIVKSILKLCNCTTYTGEFKLTFFHSKRCITLLELQSRGPLIISKVSSDSALLNAVVSLTDSHTQHAQFARLHCLDPPSLSTTLKQLLLSFLGFLKPIIRTSEKTLSWALSGVGKRCNSLSIFLTFLKTEQ